MTTRAGVAVAAVASLFAIATGAQRLPPSVVPSHYDIHFSPDFATDTFGGRVTIDVSLEDPTSSVVLNAAEIEVQEAVITAGSLKQPARVAVDTENETLTLTVEQPVPAGSATISIRYSGTLNDKLRGLYLSRANNREYAITQLEATDARRAFPSFDEPALKATFAVSATIDSGDTAISNGRVIADTPGPGAGKHTLRFATTKRMSPYLVALAVGDWECVSTDGGPHPRARVRNRRIEGSARLCARRVGVCAAVLQPLLRHRLPVRQARHRRRARLRRRRHGEHRALFSSASSFCWSERTARQSCESR